MKLAVALGEVGQSPIRVCIMKLTSNYQPAWTVSEPPTALKGVSSAGERGVSVFWFEIACASTSLTCRMCKN